MNGENDKDTQRVVINISSAAFARLLLFLLLLVFLYFTRDIIGLIFAALILALALDPWVDWLQKRKIPRTLGVIIIYVLLFAVFSLSIILLIPPLVQQVSDIAANFPTHYDKAVAALEGLQLPYDINLKEQLAKQLGKLGEIAASAATSMFSTILSFFGGVFSLFLILVLALYFIIAEEGLKGFIRSITPQQHKTYVIELIERMQRQLGLWLQGQILLSFIIFVMTFIGLLIVGVKYALLLAFLMGVFEIIPLMGPIIGAIPGVFFALTQSPGKALLAVLVYIIVQQGESNLIVPRVMSKSVDLNPVVVFIAVLIGAKLGGIMGALLAVPVAAAGSIIVNDLLTHKATAEAHQSAKSVKSASISGSDK